MSNGARKTRLRDFKKHVLEGLRMAYTVERRDNGSYTLESKEHGVIDIYPMADKVLIRDDNKWIKNGLEWVCNNL